MFKSYTVEKLIELFNEKHSAIYQINRGAGVLLIDDNGVYFLLVKPKFWECGLENTLIKFGGIGGSIEGKESPIECLKREIQEEVQTSFEDIRFAFPITTLVIDNENVVDEIVLQQESDIPAPIYILELKLPLRSDKKTEGKLHSCLHLFVYLARLINKCELKISKTENITAIMHVHKSKLSEILEGKVMIENKVVSDGIKIYWNCNLDVEIPSRITLHPRFSPIGLVRAKLDFNKLMSFFDQNGQF